MCLKLNLAQRTAILAVVSLPLYASGVAALPLQDANTKGVRHDMTGSLSSTADDTLEVSPPPNT